MPSLTSARSAGRALATLALLLPLLCALSAGRAEAQTRAEIAEARNLFNQGSELAAQERWAEALPLFRRSLALVERPSTTFNIASVLARLGRNIEAIQTLDEMNSRRIPRALRAPIEELRHRLEGLVAVLDLRLSPIDAEVVVDGEASPATGPERRLVLDPGEHLVTVQHRGYEAEQLRVSMLAGEHEERQIVLRAVESRLVITTDREDAVIRIDGEIVGTGRAEATLRPGEHEVIVHADGHEDYQRTIELSPGERIEVRAALNGSSIASDPVFWVIFGVAVLAAGAAVGVAVGLTEQEPLYAGQSGIILTP